MLKGPSRALVALVLTALLVTACGSPTSSHGTAVLGQPPAAHGTASVGLAGSLEGVVQTTLQPAFERASGDRFVGDFEGSTDIAQSILDGEYSPGAFVSIGPTAIKSLWPSRSHFALTLATDPLVVAYSPESRYAKQLNEIRSGAKPLRYLFTLLERPGFRLGRTNANDDPQGGYFELMFELAERELGLPAGTAARILGTTGTTPSTDIGSSTQVVSEDALPTDISTASVDAGSEFLTEARQYKLDYITLPKTLDFADPAEQSLYSSVSLNLVGDLVFEGGLITLDETYVLPAKTTSVTAADTAADQSFLAFLVSKSGRALLGKVGYTLGTPSLSLAPGFTSAAAVLPAPVLAAYDARGGTVAAQ